MKLKLESKKDNPNPVWVHRGFSVVQVGPTTTFLDKDKKLWQFSHREGRVGPKLVDQMILKIEEDTNETSHN